MTRLIDKKDVLEAVKALPAELDAEAVQRCIEIVSNQPEVDAIPVDFIRSEIERMKKGSNRYYSECEAYADDLDILLAEWERGKKNEQTD